MTATDPRAIVPVPASELWQLREDAARLDFMIADECQVWEVNGLYEIHAVTEHHAITREFCSARSAIDAARQNAKRVHKETCVVFDPFYLPCDCGADTAFTPDQLAAKLDEWSALLLLLRSKVLKK